MPKQKHTHKLKRHKYKSGNITYFCVLDCDYKVAPALALGKKAICWRCGNEFTLNEYAIRLAEPHCEDCHKPKNEQPTIKSITVYQTEANIVKDNDILSSLQNRLVPKTEDEDL